MKGIVSCVTTIALIAGTYCEPSMAKSSSQPSGKTIELEFAPPLLSSRKKEHPRYVKKQVVCARVTQSIQVDGALDDAAWNKVRVEGLAAVQGVPPAQFKIAFDADTLYVGVQCTQPPGTGIRGQKYPHNQGGPWRDDCVELFLTVPTPKGPSKLQFIVNAAGSTFAISNDEFYDAERSTFDRPWTAAVKSEGERWTVEIAIPKSTLGLKEWPAQMHFNIGRNGPPPIRTQPWGPEYGVTGVGNLNFEGVTDKPTVSKPTKKPGNGRSAKTHIAGEGLQLSFDRSYARPGERWIEGKIAVVTDTPLDRCKVRAEVRSMSDNTLLDARELAPTFGAGRVNVDLRSHDTTEGELVVRLFENGKETSVARSLLSAQSPTMTLTNGQRIALTVDAAKETGVVDDCPVTFGVPFPEGALWDINAVRLVDAKGKSVPAQTEVMGRWSRGGAIKWMRIDTQVSSDGNYFVEVGKASTGSSTRVTVSSESPDRVVLDTGVARYVVAKGNSPIREVWKGKQKVATSDAVRGLYVIDQKGREAIATADEETLQIEASGPQAACVRLEGWYKTKEGEALARHITRIEAFAGQPCAKVTHTLVLCRDSNEVWFKDIGWEFSVANGANPRALFGIDRDKPSESVTQTLGGSVRSAYMVQDDHVHFNTGTNHCRVSTTDAAGASMTVREGKECGDWAVLANDGTAFMAACRESARQHPKEFEATADKLILRLFSNRAGEELDFRAQTLVKYWNLKEWLKFTPDVINHYKDQTVESAYADAEKVPSNAIGWAKTHDLIFAPLPPTDAATAAARLVGPLTFPVYVHVDPQWVYRTEAFGPLHPKDAARFPEAEEVLDKVFEEYDSRDTKTGFYGFIFFNTGPYPFPSASDKWGRAGARWKYTYNVRKDYLLMAARSLDRPVWWRAIESNRSATDTYFAHWDGPNRPRGHWLHGDGADGIVATSVGLPFLWQCTTDYDTGASSEPENIIYLYYLTGDRRAREVAENFFRVCKADWSPYRVRDAYFPMVFLTVYATGYAFTGDPEMADLTRATLDMYYDPESPLLINQFAYSASYKVDQKFDTLLNAYAALGDARLYELAMTRGRFLEDLQLSLVIRYQSAQGYVSSFLYRQSGDAYVAENAALFLRQLGKFYDPQRKALVGTADIAHAAARVGVLMNGLFYSQDTVVRSGADRKSVASWAGASFWENEREEKPGMAGSIIVEKQSRRQLDLHYFGYYATATRGEVRVKRLEGKEGDLGTDLNQLWTWVDGYTPRILIEKYAPPGPYEITGGQIQFAIANENCRMVVHAPGSWTPYPDQRPFFPIYFKVPADAKDAAIVFEGTARLFDPEGKPFPNEKPVTGEVKLPVERAGLWSFQPVENKKIRVVNLPPFFAWRDPAFYFEPNLLQSSK